MIQPENSPADPFVGRIVHGDLAIEELVGRGAMARVYRARQGRVDRPVAVKLLHSELMKDATAVLRFQREARAAGRIRHPNMVEVFWAGELSAREAGVPGQPFLVFEFLEGTTLKAALEGSTGGFETRRALHVVLQIADALGEAHSLGIVHRDLKPENVMLVRRGHDSDFVKLLDFGLSRLDDGDIDFATREGAVLGTARYLSPEAARGEPVGPAGDVYAMATVLFECLAGRTPFDADNPVALLVRRTRETAADVRSLPHAESVPSPIAELVAKSLSRDPKARPQDARSFGRLLLDAARSSGLDPDGLLPRSTLLGTRSFAVPSLAAEATMPAGAGASHIDSPARAVPGAPLKRSARAQGSLGRLFVVVACFALGVLGALVIASRLGAFHGGGP